MNDVLILKINNSIISIKIFVNIFWLLHSLYIYVLHM